MANNLAAFKAEIWSKQLILNLDKINVMSPLVNDDWEGELKGKGSTVYVRTLGNITLGAYTGTISYQDLAPVKEPMTVNDAQYFAFQVDDLDEAQSDMDALDAYTMRAAVGVNDTIEGKLLSKYASCAAANKITGASNAAIALTKDNVYSYAVQARTNLSKQSVPSIGRWMVIDPDTTGLFLQAPEFIRATNLGDGIVTLGRVGNAERAGFVGRIAGFDVFESNNVPVSGGAKYIQYGDRYAIAYAAQINEMEALRLQNSFASAVRGLLFHDCTVFAEGAKRFGHLKAAA